MMTPPQMQGRFGLLAVALLLCASCTTAGDSQQAGSEGPITAPDTEEPSTGPEADFLDTEEIPTEPDGLSETCVANESYEEPPAESEQIGSTPEEALEFFLAGSLEAYRSRPDTLLPGQQLLDQIEAGEDLTPEQLDGGAEGLITVALVEQALVALEEANEQAALGEIVEESGAVIYSVGSGDTTVKMVALSTPGAAEDRWWASGFSYPVLAEFCSS